MTVAGTVISSADNQPIVGANIYVEGHERRHDHRRRRQLQTDRARFGQDGHRFVPGLRHQENLRPGHPSLQTHHAGRRFEQTRRRGGGRLRRAEERVARGRRAVGQAERPANLVEQPLDLVQRQDRRRDRRAEIGRAGRRRRQFLDPRNLDLRIGTVAAADPRRRGNHQPDAQQHPARDHRVVLGAQGRHGHGPLRFARSQRRDDHHHEKRPRLGENDHQPARRVRRLGPDPRSEGRRRHHLHGDLQRGPHHARRKALLQQREDHGNQTGTRPLRLPQRRLVRHAVQGLHLQPELQLQHDGRSQEDRLLPQRLGLQRERHHAQARSLEIRHQHQRPEIPVPGQCLGRRHQDHPRVAEDEHPAALPPRPDPERLGPLRLRHDRHALRIPRDAARRGIGHVRALPEPTTPGTAASSPTPTPSCAAATATSSAATSPRR